MTPTIRRLRSTLRDDRGSGGGLALIVLVFAIGLMVVFGLIVDGGAKAAGYDRANRIAMEAARAGAQALTGDDVDAPIPVDSVVQQYLTAEGVTGEVTVTGDRVDVTVHFQQPTKIVSIIGIDSIALTGHGFAVATYRNLAAP